MDTDGCCNSLIKEHHLEFGAGENSEGLKLGSTKSEA